MKVLILGGGASGLMAALSAAQEIAGLRDTAVFSFGSDGTDGPTDASCSPPATAGAT